jgi:predicted nucleic acid-binding protein
VRFVDTNILLYAVSRDRGERNKAAVAQELLTHRDLALSTQVLAELYVQATRGTRRDALSDADIADYIRALCRFPVQAITVEVMTAAMQTSDRFQVSYWDAAIIEAARTLGCDTVLSEDLSDGQDYAGVTVNNPFA